MATDLFCTCCSRKLNPKRIVGLELDQRVNEYHDFGGVPSDESQGWFDFGTSCAEKVRRKARAALMNVLTMGHIVNTGPTEVPFIVRFTLGVKEVGTREFTAQLRDGKVTQLHRITQEAGGRVMGGSIDKFTSVSTNEHLFSHVAGILTKALEAAKVAA